MRERRKKLKRFPQNCTDAQDRFYPTKQCTRFRRGQYFFGRTVRADIFNRSRTHIPTQFYPTPVASVGENLDCQTRRLLIGGRNGAAIFRVRGTSRRTHAREDKGLDLTLV